MDERHAQFLKLVVDEAIARAEPIGSQHLVDTHQLDVSPATVRNVLADLEEQGFLCQPHTSSGRLPTEAGYRYYIDHLLLPQPPPRRSWDALTESLRGLADSELRVKAFGKKLADVTGNASVIRFHPSDTYYTGLSALFAQPEFRDWSRVISLGDILDRLGDILSRLQRLDTSKPVIRIGSDCPFGVQCGSVIVQLPRNQGLFCVIGPQRMPYAQHLGWLHAFTTFLTE